MSAQPIRHVANRHRLRLICRALLLVAATADLQTVAAGVEAPGNDASTAALPAGADGRSPAGAMKLYVLALSHFHGARMADAVASAGADDDRFISENDDLTAALARLRAASTARLGPDATHHLARGALAVPTPAQVQRLFSRMDADLPAADEVKGEAVKFGPAANEFYVAGAARRDGKWKVNLLPGVTRRDVMRAERGDIPAFTRAIDDLAGALADGRIAAAREAEAAFEVAGRSLGQSRQGIAPPPAGPKARWSFRLGRAFEYRLVECSASLFGRDIDARISLTLHTKWSVRPADRERTAVIDIAVKRAGFDLVLPGLNSVRRKDAAGQTRLYAATELRRTLTLVLPPGGDTSPSSRPTSAPSPAEASE